MELLWSHSLFFLWTNYWLTHSFPNLALAEKEGASDFVAPCSACYRNPYFTNAYLKKDLELAEHINYALEADNLHISGTLRVRHLIEVIMEDVGLDEVRKKIVQPLKNLHVHHTTDVNFYAHARIMWNVSRSFGFLKTCCQHWEAAPIEYPSSTALLRRLF